MNGEQSGQRRVSNSKRTGVETRKPQSWAYWPHGKSKVSFPPGIPVLPEQTSSVSLYSRPLWRKKRGLKADESTLSEAKPPALASDPTETERFDIEEGSGCRVEEHKNSLFRAKRYGIPCVKFAQEPPQNIGYNSFAWPCRRTELFTFDASLGKSNVCLNDRWAVL